jgi:hypothetical protein
MLFKVKEIDHRLSPGLGVEAPGGLTAQQAVRQKAVAVLQLEAGEVLRQ